MVVTAWTTCFSAPELLESFPPSSFSEINETQLKTCVKSQSVKHWSTSCLLIFWRSTERGPPARQIQAVSVPLSLGWEQCLGIRTYRRQEAVSCRGTLSVHARTSTSTRISLPSQTCFCSLFFKLGCLKSMYVQSLKHAKMVWHQNWSIFNLNKCVFNLRPAASTQENRWRCASWSWGSWLQVTLFFGNPLGFVQKVDGFGQCYFGWLEIKFFKPLSGVPLNGG